MARFKIKSRAFTGLVVALLAVGVGVYFFGFRHGDKQAGTNSMSNQVTRPATNPATGQAQASKVSAKNFTYLQPAGWATLPQANLDAESATSGIAEVASPNAKFTVAVEPSSSTPASQSDLQNSVLAAIKQFSNFSLLASSQTQVAGQTAFEFNYNFGNSPKTRQQLTVFIYNHQAYSLLFTCQDSNFASQQAIFSKILSSFAFK